MPDSTPLLVDLDQIRTALSSRRELLPRATSTSSEHLQVACVFAAELLAGLETELAALARPAAAHRPAAPPDSIRVPVDSEDAAGRPGFVVRRWVPVGPELEPDPDDAPARRLDWLESGLEAAIDAIHADEEPAAIVSAADLEDVLSTLLDAVRQTGRRPAGVEPVDVRGTATFDPPRRPSAAVLIEGSADLLRRRLEEDWLDAREPELEPRLYVAQRADGASWALERRDVEGARVWRWRPSGRAAMVEAARMLRALTIYDDAAAWIERRIERDDARADAELEDDDEYQRELRALYRRTALRLLSHLDAGGSLLGWSLAEHRDVEDGPPPARPAAAWEYQAGRELRIELTGRIESGPATVRLCSSTDVEDALDAVWQEFGSLAHPALLSVGRQLLGAGFDRKIEPVKAPAVRTTAEIDAALEIVRRELREPATSEDGPPDADFVLERVRGLLWLDPTGPELDRGPAAVARELEDEAARGFNADAEGAA